MLEGIGRRAEGQLLDGQRTLIDWNKKVATLPTVPGSKASGATVSVAGITGRIRGLQATRPSDGAKIRPDLVIVDDPQTDESARSAKQVRDRLATMNQAILGLAGPGKAIAGVCPCTVIVKGDVADQLLDRKENPEWRGERVKLMPAEPTDIKLWERYAEIRADALRNDDGLGPATAFYIEHRAELDAGAAVSWPERFDPGEASAIQSAMNLKLRDNASFQAEFQNDPMSEVTETLLKLEPHQVTVKAIDVPQGVVPDSCEIITAGIDVQGQVLFWLIAGFDEYFGTHVVDYGAWPRQQRSHFTLGELNPTLDSLTPGATLEGRLRHGLEGLTDFLADRYSHADGRRATIARMVVDANWGQSTTTVEQFAKETTHPVLPAFGRGITADRRPISEYSRKPGERLGHGWYVNERGQLIFDSNLWKTGLAERILQPIDGRGPLTLFEGSDLKHRMLAEHVTAEYPIPTQGQGRLVNVWRIRPGRSDNHLLDCLSMASVGASEQGVRIAGQVEIEQDKKRSRRRKLQVTF